jgi:outer membrane receptor protein involved in Fe transport
MPGGCELLDGGAFLGNQLAAMDSRGLSPRSDGPIQLEDPRLWQPPQEGPQLSWEATAPSRIRRTPLGITLTATGRLGDEVQAETHVTLYHRLSRIDLSWTFDFASASIGTFFDDESKLCVRWPMAFTGAICHDIAFGVIPDEGGRPFFPAGWVDISDGDKGLAYFHRGTPKHWVSGRTLVNLFAWGEDTDAIHNRTDRYRWPKSFDQRLRGRHTIEAAIFPHRGDWRAAGVVGMARSYVTPVAAYTADRHPGDLPAKMTLLTLTDPGLSATSLQVRDGEVHSRVYAAGGEPATIAAKWKRLQPVALRSLGGETLAALAPFQIGDLVLQPTGSIRENIM